MLGWIRWAQVGLVVVGVGLASSPADAWAKKPKPDPVFEAVRGALLRVAEPLPDGEPTPISAELDALAPTLLQPLVKGLADGKPVKTGVLPEQVLQALEQAEPHMAEVRSLVAAARADELVLGPDRSGVSFLAEEAPVTTLNVVGRLALYGAGCGSPSATAGHEALATRG